MNKFLYSLLIIIGGTGLYFWNQQIDARFVQSSALVQSLRDEVIENLEQVVMNLQKVVRERKSSNPTTDTSPIALGADNVTLFGGQLYYLYGGGISSSATSIQLTSLTIPQNGYEVQDSDLSATFYVTIEPGSRTRQEFVSCTTVTQNSDNTATLSGCSRGLSPIPSYAASTTLQFAHSGGSRIIFSDPPQVYNQAAFKTNDETIDGIWQFASTSVPRYDLVPANHNTGAVVSTTSEFASVRYVNVVAAAGCADGSEGAQGCVELATALEAASSTVLGTDANLVLQARYATDTPQSGCASGFSSTAGAGCGIIAQLTGKIRQTFINLAEAYTWTAAHIFSSTATFNATTTATGAVIGFGDFAQMVSSATLTGNTTPQPVFISTTTDQLALSDANDNMASRFAGFVVDDATNGATTTVQFSGVVAGFSGLTRGSIYYVQDAIGTIGTTAGTNEIRVGTAVSSTELLIDTDDNWVYVGSNTCSTAANCDIVGPSIARFAVVQAVIGGSTGCSGPSAMTDTSFSVVVAKNGATAMSFGGSPSCGGATNPDGNITGTATFTSTSSVRMLLGGSETLSAKTQTAYFYR